MRRARLSLFSADEPVEPVDRSCVDLFVNIGFLGSSRGRDIPFLIGIAVLSPKCGGNTSNKCPDQKGKGSHKGCSSPSLAGAVGRLCCGFFGCICARQNGIDACFGVYLA